MAAYAHAPANLTRMLIPALINARSRHRSPFPGQRYVAATTDMTGLYNRPSPWMPGNAAVDVLQAVRSIVWLDMGEPVGGGRLGRLAACRSSQAHTCAHYCGSEACV